MLSLNPLTDKPGRARTQPTDQRSNNRNANEEKHQASGCSKRASGIGEDRLVGNRICTRSNEGAEDKPKKGGPTQPGPRTQTKRQRTESGKDPRYQNQADENEWMHNLRVRSNETTMSDGGPAAVSKL